MSTKILINLAFLDLKKGLLNYTLWLSLASQEIKLRYRKSLLGPAWITINMGIMLTAIGPLYSLIFNQKTSIYFPQLAIGYIMWSYISNTIIESCSSLKSNERLIKQTSTPYSTFTYVCIFRNIINLLHNLIILMIIYIIFQESFNRSYIYFLVIPGFTILLLNITMLSFIFSTACARFSDIAQLVINGMQLSFFLTPIIWPISALGKYSYLQNFNIFYHMIEVVRAPLLGEMPNLISYLFLSISLAIFSIITITIFSRCRKSIPYWL